MCGTVTFLVRSLDRWPWIQAGVFIDRLWHLNPEFWEFFWWSKVYLITNTVWWRSLVSLSWMVGLSQPWTKKEDPMHSWSQGFSLKHTRAEAECLRHTPQSQGQFYSLLHQRGCLRPLQCKQRKNEVFYSRASEPFVITFMSGATVVRGNKAKSLFRRYCNWVSAPLRTWVSLLLRGH